LGNEIFVSYRRLDAGWAGRIYDHLEKEFQSEGVFMDVTSNEFPVVIGKEAENSKVMLAIIGESWCREDEIRRLHSVDDYVRRELEIGLRKKKRVIPIAIEDVAYLSADQLPETLRDLASLQAMRLTHKGFKSDIDRVIEVTKNRLEEVSTGKKKTWDRTLFLESARKTRGAGLQQRLTDVLDWVTRSKHSLKWGSGAKYGTAQIIPNGWTSTALSIDTTGMVYVYMNEFRRMGLFVSGANREAFIGRLNDIQGIAIPIEKATQAFIAFQIRNVDQEDISSLLNIIETALGK
jgi:hypothetical protein